MRQNIKERLNKKLSDNNMTTLTDKSVVPLQPEQLSKRLHQNRTYDNSECENRLLNNRANDGGLYGNGMYDDRRYDNYYTLEEPIYETRPTFLQAITPGNEQLIVVILAGLAAYTLYILSKSKDKP